MSKLPDVTALAPHAAMRAMLQRIATGPDLSKPLKQSEACHGMRLILDRAVDDVQAAIFLIALRMKRETPEENRGVLDAIRSVIADTIVDVDDLVEVADPYNGYARTLPSAPFLPSVLAACGVATVSHGVASMGPKFGTTHEQILAAAGVDVTLTPQAAARQIEGAAAWAYLSQARFCPKLAALDALRTQIVKRPVITTVEVLARPLRPTMRAHLVTGYVHKPYPPVYSMLARHVGFDSCLLIRGTEGGVVPSLRQPSQAVRYASGADDEVWDIEPRHFDITQTVRAPPIPADVLASSPDANLSDGPDFSVAKMAQAAAVAGLAALGGDAGPIRDGLIYSAGLTLLHLGRCADAATGAAKAAEAIDSGAAIQQFLAAAKINTVRGE